MPEVQTEVQKQLLEHRLLVDLVFDIPRRFPYLRKPLDPIQNMPFRYGFRFTNIDTKPFPGAVVKEVNTESLDLKDVGFNEPGHEFSIGALNPDEQRVIWMPGSCKTSLQGVMWVSFHLTPVAPNAKILTYRRGFGSNSKNYDAGSNSWHADAFIQGQMETEQARTNTLIMVLTALMFWETVFGIKNTLLTILRGVYWSFAFLTVLIGNLIQ